MNSPPTRHPLARSSSTPAGVAPVPIGALKTDFTNIPVGTKLTVGSILFKMLDLPEEASSAASEAVSALQGVGEQLQTRKAAGPSAAKPNGNGPAKRTGGAEATEGDSFSRIEIRVGRISKVRTGWLLIRARDAGYACAKDGAGGGG